MSFPLRPKQASSRLADSGEPHFAGSPIIAERPVTLRPAAARPLVNAPSPQRFSSRPPVEPPPAAQLLELPRLRLSAEDRPIISGGPDGKPRRGMMRSVALAALCALAGIGAMTVYHALAGGAPLLH